MDETAAANTLRWYESLGGQLVEFIKVVPAQGKNLTSVWSPMLATVLVEACNLAESVLYDLTPDPAPILPKAIPRKHIRLDHYGQLYSRQFRLPHRKAAFFQEPIGWRSPFTCWARRKRNPRTGKLEFSQPDWWATHNASKHRRLDHFDEFTLDKAIDALAGAFLIIATAPICPKGIELALAMDRNNWMMGAPWPRKHWQDFYDDDQSFPGLQWVCPETALFAAPIGEPPLPENVTDLQSGMIVKGGVKIRKWLGLT